MAPAHRALFLSTAFRPGKARPVVLSLALEEAEEDGAHQVGLLIWVLDTDGLGVPTFFISLPTISGRSPGPGHRVTVGWGHGWALLPAAGTARPRRSWGLSSAASPSWLRPLTRAESRGVANRSLAWETGESRVFFVWASWGLEGSAFGPRLQWARWGCVEGRGLFRRSGAGDCLAVCSPKSFLLFLSETRTPGKKGRGGAERYWRRFKIKSHGSGRCLLVHAAAPHF